MQVDPEHVHCLSVTSARGTHFFLAATEYEHQKWNFFLHLAAGSLSDDMCASLSVIFFGRNSFSLSLSLSLSLPLSLDADGHLLNFNVSL